MTCIVGIAQDGIVYMGSDHASVTDDWELIMPVRRKVFMRGEMVLGVSGDVRISQLLRYAFEPPPACEPLDKYIIVECVAALKTMLKEDGRKEDNLLDGSAIMIGIKGRLFAIYEGWQVTETVSGYASIGAAAELALGSLHTSKALAPHLRIEHALHAALAHNASIREPFTYINTQQGDGEA